MYERDTVPILARGVVVVPNGSVIGNRSLVRLRGPPFLPVLQNGTVRKYGGPPYTIHVMLKMTKLSKREAAIAFGRDCTRCHPQHATRAKHVVAVTVANSMHCGARTRVVQLQFCSLED